MIQTLEGEIDNLINSRKRCGLRCLLPSETSECHYGDYFRWDAWILVSKPSSKSDLSLVKRYSVVVPRMRTFEWYSRPDYAYTVLRWKMRLRSWAMEIPRPEKKQPNPLMRLVLRRKSKVTCGAEIHCIICNSFTFHAIYTASWIDQWSNQFLKSNSSLQIIQWKRLVFEKRVCWIFAPWLELIYLRFLKCFSFVWTETIESWDKWSSDRQLAFEIPRFGRSVVARDETPVNVKKPRFSHRCRAFYIFPTTKNRMINCSNMVGGIFYRRKTVTG